MGCEFCKDFFWSVNQMVSLNMISLFDECNMFTSGLDVKAPSQMLVSSLLVYARRMPAHAGRKARDQVPGYQPSGLPLVLSSLIFKMDYIKNLT